MKWLAARERELQQLHDLPLSRHPFKFFKTPMTGVAETDFGVAVLEPGYAYASEAEASEAAESEADESEAEAAEASPSAAAPASRSNGGGDDDTRPVAEEPVPLQLARPLRDGGGLAEAGSRNMSSIPGVRRADLPLLRPPLLQRSSDNADSALPRPPRASSSEPGPSRGALLGEGGGTRGGGATRQPPPPRGEFSSLAKLLDPVHRGAKRAPGRSASPKQGSAAAAATDADSTEATSTSDAAAASLDTDTRQRRPPPLVGLAARDDRRTHSPADLQQHPQSPQAPGRPRAAPRPRSPSHGRGSAPSATQASPSGCYRAP